jgi:hypothetical protein
MGWSLQPGGSPAPAANTGQAPAPAQAPSGNISDPAMRAASQQVAQPHSTLPAPHPQQPSRINKASGLMGYLTMAITNAAAAHKEKKINDAMANYMTIYNAQQRAEDLVNQSGETDPAKRKQMVQQFVSADPSVKDTFYGKQGEKNVKAMKDLLKVDFTDPESMNTVQHQALKKVGGIIKAQDMMSVVGDLRQKFAQHSQQQAQPSAQPQSDPNALSANVAKRAVDQSVPIPVDVKAATELANADANVKKSNADMVKAQADARAKFSTKVTAEGNLLAFDATTGKATPLTDENGKALTAQTKVGAGEGKVAMVDTIPIGITHAGPDGKPRVITPDMPEWTPQDAKVFSVAKAAADASQKQKVDLAQKRYEFLLNRPQGVLVTEDDPQRGLKKGQLTFVTQREAAATPGKYAPVAAGDKAMQTQARFGEIQAAMDGVTSAIDQLGDKGFDAETRAKLAAVMKSPHPDSAMSTFLQSEYGQSLSDPQANYVQWLASLSESALNLATLSGQRGGSDKVRTAINNMLPGAGTPSAKYAKGQLSKLQTEYDALLKGVPSLGGLDATGNAPAATSGKGTSKVSDLVKKYGGG